MSTTHMKDYVTALDAYEKARTALGTATRDAIEAKLRTVGVTALIGASCYPTGRSYHEYECNGYEGDYRNPADEFGDPFVWAVEQVTECDAWALDALGDALSEENVAGSDFWKSSQR